MGDHRKNLRKYVRRVRLGAAEQKPKNADERAACTFLAYTCFSSRASAFISFFQVKYFSRVWRLTRQKVPMHSVNTPSPMTLGSGTDAPLPGAASNLRHRT